MNRYFVRSSHKTYAVLVHVSPLKRYLATAGICGGLFFGWYYLVYSANILRQNVLEREIAELKNHHIMHARSKDAHASIATSIDVLRSTYATYTPQAPAPAIAQLVSSAKKSNVLVNACDVGKEQDCAWYTTESLAFDVSGELPKLMQFLTLLERSNIVLQIEHMRLSALQNKTCNLSCTAQLITLK